MTTDYEQLRAGRQAALNDDERANYSIIYAEAGLSGALAELVYRLRDEAGLTQTELARRMGSTQSSIARMEAGSQTPRIDLLDRLGRALGTPRTLSAAGQGR